MGGLIMYLAYDEVSTQCRSYPDPGCWDPDFLSALAFYIGAFITMVGSIIFVGEDIAKLLGKLRGG